ncbi:hypothetical protein V5N11_023124 [Cardamine amara subsp. amara]|uniref:NYN domain-containing protein n=1 Tax=Cardamine amara subsp. amara TaxID=228776 RepID=A0ABD0ZR44_CARAN
MMESATKEAAVNVFWGIQMCPVPDGCDARRVGPCIKRYLRELGYSGPITITAVDVLSDVPPKTLEAVFTTGISLYNGPLGLKDMSGCIRDCCDIHESPINIMAISSFPETISILRRGIAHFGFKLILANAETLSEILLVSEEDMCSETSESALWTCAVCKKFDGRDKQFHHASLFSRT